MMIHKTANGIFVISSRDVWIPGCYDTERAARYAYSFSNRVLADLQEKKNAENGGYDGVITMNDLKEARRKAREQ